MHLIQPDCTPPRLPAPLRPARPERHRALPLALTSAAIGESRRVQRHRLQALVCVFLYGGNGYANTVVTYDDASATSTAPSRGGGAGQAAGGIALAKAALTPAAQSCRAAVAGASACIRR